MDTFEIQTFPAARSSFDTNLPMIKLLSLLFLLSAIANCSVGQRTLLMLEKKNKNKNAYYEVGDKISFRLDGSNRKISGEIIGFRDSVILFKEFEVSVNEISSLYIDEKTKWWLRYKIEQLSLIIGCGYLLIDVINNRELTEDTLIISGTLISVGLLAKVFIGNKIKIRGRTKLKILKL